MSTNISSRALLCAATALALAACSESTTSTLTEVPSEPSSQIGIACRNL